MIKEAYKKFVPKAVQNNIRHFLRETSSKIYERPISGFREALLAEHDRSFQSLADKLVNDGIISLPNYLDHATTNRIHEQFKKNIEKSEPNVNLEIFTSKDLLTSSREISQLATDKFILDLVRYYWGKPVVLAEVSGYRILPMEPRRYGPFRWHHDTVGRQIKVFLLLTDVPKDGQCMEYVPGTNNFRHKYSSYEETRFADEEVLKYGRPVQCTGSAGTVLIFDTNGFHQGNRNFGPIRDAWCMNFTAGRNLFDVPELHPEVLKTLCDKTSDRQTFRING